MTAFTCVTLRLARFPEPVTLPAVDPLLDTGESTWLLGSDDMVDGQRIGSRTASVWACLGLHRDLGPATEGFGSSGPYGDVLDGAAETWSTLLEPYSHRGSTNWGPEPLLPAGNRRSHSGPFVVVTTVGFDEERDADGTRTREFIRGVAEVRAVFAEDPAVEVEQAFWFGRTWVDPFTLTVWTGDDHLRAPVYEDGAHRRRMDDYRRNATAERTSFTRLRVLRSEGSWGGRSPIG